MASILETAVQELFDFEKDEEEDSKGKTNNFVVTPTMSTQPEEIVEQDMLSEVLESDRFTPFQSLQLEEQLRMHIQLLTQSYILSYGIHELQDMTCSTLSLVEELKGHSTRMLPNGKRSYFYADNLDEAVAIVCNYESETTIPTTTVSKFPNKQQRIPCKAQTTMANSKAFIYPHLLPTVGFKPTMAMKFRVYFTEAEDRLLALGLEQFSGSDNIIQRVQAHLLPTKTIAQIKLRIKNLKGSKGSMNPVKYFYLNEQVPPINPTVRAYDPITTRKPCELPSDILPVWMAPYVKTLPPLAPAPPQTPKVAIVHPLSYKTVERRRYQRILPRVSPFKRISPFLKKYVHHRRIVPVAPLSPVVSNPCLESPVKRTSRMVPIRPKPSPEITISSVDSSRMIPIRPKPLTDSQHIPILPKPIANDIHVVPMTIASCFLPVENQFVDTSFIPSTIIPSASSVITPISSTVIGSAITCPVTVVEPILTTTLQPEPNFVTQNIQLEVKPENSEGLSSSSQIIGNTSSESMCVLFDTSGQDLNDSDETKMKCNIIEEKNNQCKTETINMDEYKMEIDENQENTSNKTEQLDRIRIEKNKSKNEERTKISCDMKKGEIPNKTGSIEKPSLIQNKSVSSVSVTRASKIKSLAGVNVENTGKEKYSASSNVKSTKEKYLVNNNAFNSAKEKSATLNNPINMKEKSVSNNSNTNGKEKSAPLANIANSTKVKSSTSTSGVSSAKTKSATLTSGNVNRKEKSTTRATTSRNDLSQHVEATEDADDEAVDDEQDLAALMVASSTICKKQNSSNKKKSKHQRDLESTLQLLIPNILESDPKRGEREKMFAQSYLLRVMEALKNDPTRCENFLKLLCSYEYSTKSPIKLYSEIQDILRDHPALINEFVGFLSPEQARECGKFIEYNTLNKIRVFLRKIEIHFSSQPHHIQRILKTLGQFQNQPNLTSASVISALQPLLRNQSHLLEEFLQLLPDEPPPEWLMTDFEDVTIPLSDGDNSSVDSFEEIVIPEAKDPYGGKDCPCPCHSTNVDVRAQNKNKHCVKCGTKFIDGRIFIQTGKVLKPAQVVYNSVNLPAASSTQTKPEANKTSSETGSKYTSSNDRHKKEIPNNLSENRFSPVSRGVLSFPCDVTEDAVLPPVSSSGLAVSIPSDFSHLQEAITSHTKHTAASSTNKECNKHLKVKITENTNNSLRLKFTGTKSSVRTRADNRGINPIQRPNDDWSREQDKIIINTCKAHGINKESFHIASTKLSSKTVEQCESRLQVLMQRLEQHLKNTKR